MSKGLLEQCGYKVPYNETDKTMSAFLSLKLALTSYFSTADFDTLLYIEDNDEEITLSAEYQERYLKTIFHFHHFFELLFKDTLRTINPLLASKAVLDSDDGKRILKLLQGDLEAVKFIRTVEFNKALNRLRSFADEGNMPQLCRVIAEKDSFKTLKDLNELRNSAWHDGTWILRFTDFEKFIGSRIFPLVTKSIESSIYKNFDHLWKYNNPVSKINPINNIINLTSSPKIDFNLVGLNKAIAKANYNVSEDYIATYEVPDSELKRLARKYNVYKVQKCFVCRHYTLFLNGWESSMSDEKGNLEYFERKVDRANCMTCKLELRKSYGEPSIYDNNIPLLWESWVFETDK